MEEKNQEAQIAKDQPKMNYEISEEVINILRKFFGTKSFVDVADVIPLLKKKVLAEEEINMIINRLGIYPYDEVEAIFNMLPKSIKQFPEAEPVDVSAKSDSAE